MTPDRLPARPNLEQYKKQPKIRKVFSLRRTEARDRAKRHHPRLRTLTRLELSRARISLTDAN